MDDTQAFVDKVHDTQKKAEKTNRITVKEHQAKSCLINSTVNRTPLHENKKAASPPGSEWLAALLFVY